MSRPSANLDKKMIEAGRKIMSTEGAQGLSIINICNVAKVNKGMFNYHFKTKESYLKLLYGGIIKEMNDLINIDSHPNKTALEKLKIVTLSIAKFISYNKQIMSFFIIDGLDDKPQTPSAKKFLQEHELLSVYILESIKQNLIKKGTSPIEVYSALYMGVLMVEVFKDVLIEREKAVGLENQEFQYYPIEKRYDNIMKDYIVQLPLNS